MCSSNLTERNLDKKGWLSLAGSRNDVERPLLYAFSIFILKEVCVANIKFYCIANLLFLMTSAKATHEVMYCGLIYLKGKSILPAKVLSSSQGVGCTFVLQSEHKLLLVPSRGLLSLT